MSAPDNYWHTRAEELEQERDEARAEVGKLRRERDEARTEILALKECLRWYVENDDTIAGGKWDEDNATWLEGKRLAVRLLGMRE